MADSTNIKKYLGLNAVERLIENIKVELSKKQDSGLCVPIDQGTDNAGKFLCVGSDGKVVPTESSGSGGGGNLGGIIQWGDFIAANAYVWGNMNGSITK